MRAILAGATVLCVCATCAVHARADAYVPKGPPETAEFEKALYDLLPVYAYGFDVAPERWSQGLTAADLSPGDAGRLRNYRAKIAGWLNEMLRPEVGPPQGVDKDDWRLFPRPWLMRYTDLIVGRWCTSAEQQGQYARARLEFRASSQRLYVAVASDRLFPLSAEHMTDALVVEAVTKVLRIPAEKVGSIRVDRRLDTAAGQRVCHGVLRCEWQDGWGSDISKLKTSKWWNRIGFWCTKGRLFVSFHTRDPTTATTAPANPTWWFETVVLPLGWDRQRLWDEITTYLTREARRDMPGCQITVEGEHLTIAYRARQHYVTGAGNESGTQRFSGWETYPRSDGLIVAVCLEDQQDQSKRPQTLQQPWGQTKLRQVHLPQLGTYLKANVSYGRKMVDGRLDMKYTSVRSWVNAVCADRTQSQD